VESGGGSSQKKAPPISGVEDAKRILIKCSKTKNLREEFVCSRCLSTNEDKACKNITNSTNVTNKKKYIGIYIFRTKFKLVS
jgi:hypothetical protein